LLRERLWRATDVTRLVAQPAAAGNEKGGYANSLPGVCGFL
jgi:hypothetical protein